MPKVALPDGRMVEFPDGTDTAVMERALSDFLKADAPAPDRGLGVKAFRAAEFASRGIMDSAAETVGAAPDLIGKGLSKLGVPGIEEGWYTRQLKEALAKLGRFTSAPLKAAADYAGVDLGSDSPETAGEKVAYGTGRGAADAASVMIPAASAARLTQAGTLGNRVATTMASQPALQASAGAVGGAVGEATDSPLTGTAAAVATPVLAAAGRRVVSPVRSQLTPEDARLAQVAADEGIDLSAGARTGSRPLQAMESVFSTLPLTAGPQRAQIDRTAKQFNRAVLQRAGIDADRATPDVLRANTERLGREFDRISAATIVRADDQLLDDLQGVMTRYGTKMPSQQREVVQAWVTDVLATGDTIPGQVYQQARSDLTRQVQGSLKTDPGLSQALRGIRDALDNAADRAIPEDLRQAWGAARSQWAAKKQIEAAATTGGNVSPAKLKTAVSAGNRGAFAEGRGELNDLARVGDRFVKEQVPNSGTPERTALIQLLTGGAVGGLAADPLMGAATAGTTMLLPRVIQGAYNSGAGQAYLGNRVAAGAESPYRALAAILAAQGKDRYLSAP